MPAYPLIRFFGYVVDRFFLHCGGQQIPNPIKSRLNSLSIPLLSIGHNLNHPIWAPQDPMSYTRRARLTCSTDNMRSQWFFSHRCCHELIAESNRSALLQNLLQFKGTLIKTTSFQVMGSALVRWCFLFLYPRFCSSQRDKVLKAPPFLPYFPS